MLGKITVCRFIAPSVTGWLLWCWKRGLSFQQILEFVGMFFFVGATPVGQDAATAPSNHSDKFFLDESALDLGLRAMLQVTLDYLHGGKAG